MPPGFSGIAKVNGKFRGECVEIIGQREVPDSPPNQLNIGFSFPGKEKLRLIFENDLKSRSDAYLGLYFNLRLVRFDDIQG